MLTVAVLDLGMGNLRSVERAVARAATDAGIAATVSFARRAEEIAHVDKLVFPGQGAFRDAAAALASGLGAALSERLAFGTPFLGICLGLQVLFEGSDEAPGAAGLGLFPGRVVKIPEGGREPATGAPVKVPHMGWNRLAMTRAGAGPLSVYDQQPPFVYFVHSYHAVPADSGLVAATVEHGAHRITAAVQRDNVTATQFHPEKSQAAGLSLLGRFLAG